MASQIENLYNKPLRAGIFLSAIQLIIMAITLWFYVVDPFELALNSLYQGAAFMIDMVNIFWGYVIMLCIFVLGLVIYNLGCGAERSDKPRYAKIMRVFSLCSVAFSLMLGVWFTLQVIMAYTAANS